MNYKKLCLRTHVVPCRRRQFLQLKYSPCQSLKKILSIRTSGSPDHTQNATNFNK